MKSTYAPKDNKDSGIKANNNSTMGVDTGKSTPGDVTSSDNSASGGWRIKKDSTKTKKHD